MILFFVLMLLMLSTDRIRAFFMAWSMKGPFAYPLIGNGYLAFDQKPEENFQLVYEFSEKYGSIFRIWAGPQLIIILNDPKYTETILSSQRHIAKSYEYKMLSSWLKDGLLLSKDRDKKDKKIIFFESPLLLDDGTVIPRETDVVINIFNTGRNRPRNCIGQKFAVLEIKSAISKLLRNFEISLAEETLNSPLILSAELILISKNPLNIYLHFQATVCSSILSKKLSVYQSALLNCPSVH
ncbi:Cytochrome P450 4d1 [Pseudolycoriella hygida]|uniref:Cytochrome P450 4d1 n=1 Tax=Pseudolycoriella hygida TaxID=35572 RepID=A0A9Q0MYP6_9DIPT|nr:Cytochrome P450 4d1 [Pseudolycoriella hygida]